MGIVLWSVLLIAFGRITVLLSRPAAISQD